MNTDLDLDLNSLSQQCQVEDIIELTILNGDLAPGQTVEISIASKRMTRYHLYLFFHHQTHSFDLAEVEEEAKAEKIDLTIDHMDITSSEKGYIATYDSEMCWSIQLVKWKKLVKD